MAAALRSAARRLEGYLLQRTQARRLVHGGGPEAPCRQTIPTRDPHGPNGANVEINAYRQIRDKRDELFDLLADTERRYGTDFSKERRQNIRLLQQLAVQVKPRPNDPLWRSKQRSKRINDFVGITGAFVAGYVLTKKLIHYKKEVLEATPEGGEDLAGDEQ